MKIGDTPLFDIALSPSRVQWLQYDCRIQMNLFTFHFGQRRMFNDRNSRTSLFFRLRQPYNTEIDPDKNAERAPEKNSLSNQLH